MDLALKDKVAVILASSSGIGRGIATVLAEEGCKIAICARDPDRLNLVADEIRHASGVQVLALEADVTNHVMLDKFFDKVLDHFGHIDILVNNSGGPPPGKSLDISDKEFYSAFELVLMSKIRACRRAIPSMIGNKWGRIINVESTSIKNNLENMTLSNVFRSASAAFAKTISAEYARDGIRVHTLLSGPFLTNRVSELGEIAAKKEKISFDKWKLNVEANTPLGRFGDPLEYGALVAFLASDKADYMTGSSIAIDGGILRTIN
jgi:3-oxoacyl-[acyl-carrier protein] reductase